MSRADRRRAGRSTPRREGPAGSRRETTTPRPAQTSLLDYASDSQVLARVAFVVVAGFFLVFLARAIEARITWYLAVDQFGYLQFAHDLLNGTVFHEWEPARIMGILPKRTDVLAQTYIWDDGRMYCRYSPGFPMLLAGWLTLFGEERVSFLNPTVYLTFLCVVMACVWRLTGSMWRGLVVAVLMVLCPTMMYWWSLTLTRDLSAHLFAFTGLYQLIPRGEQPIGLRRAIVAGLAIGFAGSIRNDAVLYLIPATLLVGAGWWREWPAMRTVVKLAGGAAAGLLLGLLPTLAYNTITTGNPFRPTQGMEIQSFLPGTTPPPVTFGAPRVQYAPPAPAPQGRTRTRSGLWKGGTYVQVQGGGLRIENFWRTAPAEWHFVWVSYGWVLLGLAALGAIVALARHPILFLFAVPYTVIAFLFYSCWASPDRRYIIGLYTMVPVLIMEGVFGSVDLVRLVADRRDEQAAKIVAVVLAVVGLAMAFAPIAMPPPTQDASYLSKGVLPMLTMVLPLAMALGAAAAALAPAQPVAQVLAPALALVLAGYGIVRADDTRGRRAPFQRPQVILARETMRRTLEPRSVVITSEEMGRPAENIEHWGGFPSFYLTDLDRWRIKPSEAALAFISARMRPYLLIDEEVPERARVLAELASQGFVADRVLEIPASRNMQYFVASPGGRAQNTELFRVSNPGWEKLLAETGAKP